MRRLLSLTLSILFLITLPGCKKGSSSSGSASASFNFDASSSVQVEVDDFSLNTLGLSLLVGQTSILPISYSGKLTVEDITFTSGDDSIATVDEDGRVVAVSAGVTYIECASAEKNLSCSVIVNEED